MGYSDLTFLAGNFFLGNHLIYVDEAHIHLDSDQGYGWSIKGERFWVSSSSPGLEKVSFYGVYLYN